MPVSFGNSQIITNRIDPDISINAKEKIIVYEDKSDNETVKNQKYE